MNIEDTTGRVDINDRHQNDRHQRVQEMEAALGMAQEQARALQTALAKARAGLASYRQLEDYYGSEYWHDDREAMDRGTFEPVGTAGVLSEDAAYDALSLWYSCAVEMVDLASQLLKPASDQR